MKLFKKRILFECAPKSGQYNINPEIAIKISRKIIEKYDDICIILSSPSKIETNNKNIIDASNISLRENAELSKYCDLLIGTSSGISWICTSGWANKIPMIQLLNTNAVWYNSLLLDHKKFKLNYKHIIELYNPSYEQIIKIIKLYISDGFETTKLLKQKPIQKSFVYFKSNFRNYIKKGLYKNACKLLFFHLLLNYNSLIFYKIIIKILFLELKIKIKHKFS